MLSNIQFLGQSALYTAWLDRFVVTIKPRGDEVMEKSIWSVFLPMALVVALLSGCAPAATPVPPTSTFTPIPPTNTPVPTATPTLIPTITPTPTPSLVTFDDNLCAIKGSFYLDGELSFTGVFAHIAIFKDIEGSPSYALSLYGNSTNGDFHNLQVWVRHNSSPGPNEMATLPDQFKESDINIYTSDNTVIHADLDQVRLKLHVIPLQVTEPGDDPLRNCDYVVEEIQLR